jgi:hypothetical protein
MLMTKKEYRRFKSKYELLGQLEKERRDTEYLDEESFRRFLDFLDEIYMLTLDTNKPPSISESELQTKIMVRKILNRLPNIEG